jgi:predicted transcriptional regulator
MHGYSVTSQTSAPLSIGSILKLLSDEKTLVLFNNIAVSDRYDSNSILKVMNMSTKQYYSRISCLLRASLIKRDKGKYFPTSLGKVVCDFQKTIGKTLSYYRKMKAIESLEISCSILPTEEIMKLIGALIDDQQIKDILMKPISALPLE